MNILKLLVLILMAAAIFSLALNFSKRNSPNYQNLNQTNTMKLESNVFTNNGSIPVKFTCNGIGDQPLLKISEAPANAKSLALVVHDPDAPVAGGFTHWVLWNIPSGTGVIDQNNLPAGTVQGLTGGGKPGWVAPCPPSGVHRYNFTIYALDTSLAIPESSDRRGLLAAIDGHILGSATLTGLYGKK